MSDLGFTVIRPLPPAPVGRTVIRPWRQGSRQFGPAMPPHRVHLFGFTLKAQGIAFHQQDSAVGACATAALWCALSTVIRRDGGRAPTPSAITAMASESLPESRIFPAISGLSRQQMIGAIQAAGYSPDVVKLTKGKSNLFILIIKTYLRSGIPIILQVTPMTDASTDGHAVTVVGYREDEDIFEIQTEKLSYLLKSRSLSRLYVHDDRIGPYARMGLEEIEGELWLVVLPYDGQKNCPEAALVDCAIVPMYPKIRMNAADLCSLAIRLLSIVAQIVGVQHRATLHVEPFFALSGGYQAIIRTLPIESSRKVELFQRLRLSRYVGVIRFLCGEAWVMDVVCDTTDILKDVPRFHLILACIATSEDHMQIMRDYFNNISISNILII